MLYPTEDYKVYGYISNTRIKFILVVDEMLQKEDEMRMVRIYCLRRQSFIPISSLPDCERLVHWAICMKSGVAPSQFSDKVDFV